MAAAVPILCFFLFLLVFSGFVHGSRRQPIRQAFVCASIAWGVLVTGVTELLSIFGLFTFHWVLTLWTVASVAMLFVLYRALPPVRPAVGPPSKGPRLSKAGIILLSLYSLIGVSVGLVALVAPPNSWDAMVYHMSRVMHWIQNQSVAHYPTHQARQLFMNPWAEFAIAQFQILSGGDRLANLAQWFSLLGSGVGASLVARELGGDPPTQALASVVAGTIPMGILQASTADNDYAVSLWCVFFAYYVLRLTRDASVESLWGDALGAGASLGLALLTKHTAYLFLFPLVLWLGIGMMRRVGVGALKTLAVIAMVPLAINMGHLVRNLQWYDWPLGPRLTAEGMSVKSSTPALMLSSVVKNVALHLGTPSRRVNEMTEKGVGLIHRALGVDVDDPRSTWEPDQGRFRVRRLSTHVGGTGNPLHLLLIVVSAGLLFTRAGRNRALWAYGLSVFLATLLFCVLLKWQPPNARLQLGLFVLWAPFVATALGYVVGERWRTVLAIVLVIGAMPWILFNVRSPLLGPRNIFERSRVDLYFPTQEKLLEEYMGAARVIASAGCRDVGFIGHRDTPEYPLWVFLREAGGIGVRIEQVLVPNRSPQVGGRGGFGNSWPCAIVAVNVSPIEWISTTRGIYTREWSLGGSVVLVRQ